MKNINRWLRKLMILVGLVLLMMVIPAIPALASPDGQTIPTAVPDTDTPTITSVPSTTNTPTITTMPSSTNSPAITTMPSSTNIPGKPSGSTAATNTSTALVSRSFVVPTLDPAARTATYQAGNMSAAVTLTTLPPTNTVSAIALTSTATGVSGTTYPTTILTSEAQNTPTLPNSNPGQTTFDNGSFLLGVGTLALILAVYIWSRGRNKGPGSS
jgi:hypothetical protein